MRPHLFHKASRPQNVGSNDKTPPKPEKSGNTSSSKAEKALARSSARGFRKLTRQTAGRPVHVETPQLKASKGLDPMTQLKNLRWLAILSKPGMADIKALAGELSRSGINNDAIYADRLRQLTQLAQRLQETMDRMDNLKPIDSDGVKKLAVTAGALRAIFQRLKGCPFEKYGAKSVASRIEGLRQQADIALKELPASARPNASDIDAEISALSTNDMTGFKTSHAATTGFLWSYFGLDALSRLPSDLFRPELRELRRLPVKDLGNIIDRYDKTADSDPSKVDLAVKVYVGLESIKVALDAFLDRAAGDKYLQKNHPEELKDLKMASNAHGNWMEQFQKALIGQQPLDHDGQS